MARFTVPQYITVHLGAPDAPAENVRVPFIDYVKNVASSEIYPTWPENALRANMYAQISFALNRVYSEWYRSRGYDFDITSSTQYDQKFVKGRDIFDSVSKIADEIFNDYIVRQDMVQPLFAQYCNGTTVTCRGLSQWGTVSLAEEGLTPYEILQYYYGDDITIVFNAPTAPTLPSYPGFPLKRGSIGEDVRTLQRQLNRVSRNYPSIRPELALDGYFGANTEQTVKKFQTTFNLDVDGVVGKATWYKVKAIFNAVKRIADIQSEGLTLSEVDRIFRELLRLGDTGIDVQNLQYYLAVVAYFDNSIPAPVENGVFDPQTEAAVRAFQASEGLREDGIVGRDTWGALIRRYDALLASLPDLLGDDAAYVYPGRFLSLGSTGEPVLELQKLINRAAASDPSIPSVAEDGVYGEETEKAIRVIQQKNGLDVTGVTGLTTWETVVRLATGKGT